LTAKMRTLLGLLGKRPPVDAKYLLLVLMVVGYPLVVMPGQWQLPLLADYPWDYFYAPRYPILAVIALAALLVLLRDAARISHPAFIPLGVFLFFAFIAASLAAYPLTAWVGAPMRYTGLSTYLFCVLLFILASRTAGGKSLLPPLVAAAAVVSGLAVLQAGGFNPVPHESFRAGLTAYGTLGHPEYLGAYAAFVLPAALYVYLRRRSPVWLAAAALIFAGLLVSFNWGAWLGAFCGLAVVARYAFTGGEKMAWPVPAATLLSVILAFAAGVVFGGLADKVGVVALREQVVVWESTLHLLSKCWAFGLGPDHLAHVVGILPFTALLPKTPSLYLETAVTMGVFALLAFLAFVGFVLRETWSRLGAQHVFSAMIVVYLVQGLFHFENIIVMPLFWIVLGLALAGAAGAEPVREAATLPGEAAARGGASAAAAAEGK